MITHLILALSCIVTLYLPTCIHSAQRPVFQPDLSALVKGDGGKIHNRGVTSLGEADRRGVRLDQKPGDGIAWFDSLLFTEGTIEFDVRGKDIFQGSFVGIAFHGVDEKTYDAVYFRPFNFKSEDAARRNHAVQYISHPQQTWQRLRSEKPERYEKAVQPVPDPNSWFHARIVIAGLKVSVYVNDASEPCLSVDRLSGRNTGWVGLWVGNNSGGDFANLRVIPAETR